ncbi:hypothetical protein [Aurantiacibacter odishensis]|uniref:hypothetical protein n=1 Tax=Aurantiacibacter odishensis TaxID=1155476 RepID=UPI000E740FBD|nr:hypothetical protein [Aurantiacibacter odishensis]
MTQTLGIITAFGAVAVLGWLAVLLYPRLIPSAGALSAENRLRPAILFIVASALAYALAMTIRAGGPLAGDDPISLTLAQIVIYAPFIALAGFLRTRAALLVPQGNTLRSVAIGIGITVLALAAYYSSTDGWRHVPLLGEALLSGDAAAIALRSILRCLVVGMFIAVFSAAWSSRVVLLIGGVAIALTQVPSLLAEGFSAAWLGVLIAHVALVTGLLSAILATRNIVWFWPVLSGLNLLLFSLP